MSGDEGSGTTELLESDEQLDARLEHAVDWIDEADSILVASHVDPDGDAIASTLALGEILRRLGKEVVTYNRDGVPYNFAFVEGADQLVSSLDGGTFDMLVLLDCSDPGRAGEELESVQRERTVVVDHHDTVDESKSDLVVCDPSAAAAAEVVYRLADRMNVSVDRALAEPLYAALTTDTGSFQYENTSRSTFRIAGELVEAGVDPWRVTVEVYESQPRRRIELLAEVLETLEVEADGRIAFIRIDREMVDGADEDIAQLIDGFINYGRSIRGVEVSVQLRELPGDEWKISFRSKGRVDVSKLAGEYGGGGHVNAAGCRTDGRPEEIRRELTDALVSLLDGD